MLEELRRLVEEEMASHFDAVTFAATAAAASAAGRLSALRAEVTFYAVREVVRNAARHGCRRDDTALTLHVTVKADADLVITVEDNGMGSEGAANDAGAGQGLALHTGMLAVVGIHSLLEFPLWYGPFQMATGLAVALLCSGLGGEAASGTFQAKIKPKRPMVQYGRALAAITMIVALASVAVSYHRVSQIYLPPEERSAAMRDDTLEKTRGSWFFHAQALFAELVMTPLSPKNAASVHAMALELLHYSPEPRVIEKLIESAVMLGRDDEALQYLARYRAAFPQEHARWVQGNAAAQRLKQ